MEENSNMTAERSLEIITKQIEQNRRAVSRTLGQSLYISGLCIMATTVLVAVINFLAMSSGMVGIGHLLWFLLPVAIWFFSRKYIKERAHTPTNMVGQMVAKTWQTFGIFALGFFIIAIVCTAILLPMMTVAEYSVVQIRVAPIIVLLMGMAIAMSGRSGWSVVLRVGTFRGRRNAADEVRSNRALRGERLPVYAALHHHLCFRTCRPVAPRHDA